MAHRAGWLWTKAAWRETVSTEMNAITNISPSHTFPNVVVGKKVYLKHAHHVRAYIIVAMDLRYEAVGEYFLSKV